MDPTTAKYIIGLMAAAIVAMWGFIMYLYTNTINRADKRVETVEGRQFDLLLKAIGALEAMEENVRATAEYVRQQQQEREIERRAREAGR